MNPDTANLRRLCAIRSVVIAGQFLALEFAKHQLGWMLPYVTLELLLGVIALFALFCWWRSYQRWPVIELELFVQLCVDVAGFTAVLYFSGGSNNPFISYLLVPLCISATTLPLRYTWALGVMSLLAYSLLLVYFIPLAPLSPHSHQTMQGMTLNMHVAGMWMNFVVSALLIAYFVSAMASSLRQKENELAQVRERQLQDEQLLAVATLAAGTAHELGTPLATIKVISEDLREEVETDLREDVDALSEQVDHCKQILDKLVSTARDLSALQAETEPLASYVQGLVDRWQLMRPGSELVVDIAPELRAMTISLDGTVSQSILNLLNNAADVTPDQVSLSIYQDDDQLCLAIKDRGPGLPGAEGVIHKAYVSTKGKGLGLGLMLSHATAERYGGNLQWHRRRGGGSRPNRPLPLAAISHYREEDNA